MIQDVKTEKQAEIYPGAIIIYLYIRLRLLDLLLSQSIIYLCFLFLSTNFTVVKIFAHIILIFLSISHGAVISERFNVNIYLHATLDVTKRKKP